MALKAEYRRRRLQFAFHALTSRGALPYKDTWYIKVYDDASPTVYGVGEVALFHGLSEEDSPDFEHIIESYCANPTRDLNYLPSSMRFAVEAALSDMDNGGCGLPFGADINFPGIPINGLVWMGTRDEMVSRVREKLEAGFKCLKIKIGALDFEAELEMLRAVRRKFSPADLEIRVDANGAFTEVNVFKRLDALSVLSLHSIEQPVRQNQPELMRRVCQLTPMAVALDEELIGIRTNAEKADMLDFIKPQYIILKPSLCGGFSQADEWIAEAQKRGIGWWATSALESNVGLSAIAAWLQKHHTTMCQGLGTGQVFTNNVQWYASLKGEKLYLDANLKPLSFHDL